MKRRLFTILAALSLLLFLGSIGMWVRSYWRWDSVAYRGEQHLYTLDSGSGHVGVMTAHLVRDTPYERGWSVYSDPAHEVGYSGRSLSTWLAVGWDSDRGTLLGMKYRSWQLAVPYTYPALASLVLPAAWLVLHVRRGGRGCAGRCAGCGYDLRATPERCPECGTTVSTA